MTEEVWQIVRFVAITLLLVYIYRLAFRAGQRKERERMTAVGLGDTPSVRVRLYREQYDRWLAEQSTVIVIDSKRVTEPNVKLIDP